MCVVMTEFAIEFFLDFKVHKTSLNEMNCLTKEKKMQKKFNMLLINNTTKWEQYSKFHFHFFPFGGLFLY